MQGLSGLNIKTFLFYVVKSHKIIEKKIEKLNGMMNIHKSEELKLDKMTEKFIQNKKQYAKRTKIKALNKKRIPIMKNRTFLSGLSSCKMILS